MTLVQLFARTRTLLLRTALSVALVGLTAVPTPAATFVVNDTADNDDGLCEPTPADCTLREAIDAANALAGTDSIEFDPTIFPLGTPATIHATSELPALTDPAGARVSGVGAGVIIDGTACGGTDDGLIYHTTAGTALTKVTIEGLTVLRFPGEGIQICAGDPTTTCDGALSKTRIEQVVVRENGGHGLLADGATHAGTRVSESAFLGNGSDGIRLTTNNTGVLSKATVAGTVASGNGDRGINLNSSGNNLNSKVDGCTALGNGNSGINLNASDLLAGAKVLRSAAHGNDGTGINLTAGDFDLANARIQDNAASGNGGAGINLVVASGVTSKAKVSSNTANDNGEGGIRVDRPANSKITKNGAHGNTGDGIGLLDVGAGSKVEKNDASGNVGAGIALDSGVVSSKIQKNTAFGNGGTDLLDGNAACADNMWKKNAFVTTSDVCIE